MISDFFYYERLNGRETGKERQYTRFWVQTDEWETTKQEKTSKTWNDKKKRDMKTWLKINDNSDDEGKYEKQKMWDCVNSETTTREMMTNVHVIVPLILSHECHWTQWWWDAPNLPFLNFDICILVYLSGNTMVVDDNDKDWTVHSSRGKSFQEGGFLHSLPYSGRSLLTYCML